MKKIALAMALAMPAFAYADELMTFSNGATAWKNDQGHIYGMAGGVSTGDTGMNDVRTGQRFEAIGTGSYVNTQNGQVVNKPQFDKDDRD